MQPLLVWTAFSVFSKIFCTQVKPKRIDQSLPPKSLIHLLACILFDSTFKERQDFTLAGSAIFVIARWNWIHLPPPAPGYSLAPESPSFGEGSAAPLWLGLWLNHTVILTWLCLWKQRVCTLHNIIFVSWGFRPVLFCAARWKRSHAFSGEMPLCILLLSRAGIRCFPLQPGTVIPWHLAPE